MLYLIAISAALSVTFLVLAVGELVPSRPKEVRQRLATIRGTAADTVAKRSRQRRREKVEAMLEEIGERLPSPKGKDRNELRRLLIQAGYRRPGAVGMFWGIRLTLTAGLTLLALMAVPVLGLSPVATTGATIYFAVMGWILPTVAVRSRVRARQKAVQRALPDAVDLLVVCVEAGLGLNQALVRVSDEMAHAEPVLSQELTLVNAQIRAGGSRREALEALADRTGLQDVRSLTSMLIQTDRFGTSIADSLRVHSDALRTKRRQRIEEESAKTTIKMVFPLVICIFPALFVVLLAPGLIITIRALARV